MKKTFLIAMLVLISLIISACSGKDKEFSIDSDVETTISVISWAGDGVYYDDIGHTNLSVDDLKNPKVASMYANAKEFNKLFPNVKINYYGKQYGPDDGGVYWEDEIENFKNKYGEYPNVIPLMNTSGFIQKGFLADLSRFEDDIYYDQFNEGLMKQNNFYGFQAALPGYFIPAGIFVNNDLIENENLDEPSVDWTFNQFTQLVTSGQKGQGSDTYVSISAMPDWWIQQEFLYNQLFDGPMDGKYISLNNDYTKEFFRDGVSRWSDYDFYGQSDETFLEDNESWGARAFSNGKSIIHGSEPWFITDFSTATGWLPGPSGYDIYPFPSYAGSGNTISTITDPVGIFNSCNDDGLLQCSAEEELKIKVAYTFQAFSSVDTRAWEARVAQQYTDSETGSIETGVLDSSFPVTTGELYDEQMEIWFSSPRHAIYKNESMVGFQAINELIKAGNIKAISDKSYPWFYIDPDSGEQRRIFEEFLTYYAIDETYITESGWYDAFAAKLPEWEILFNERLDDVFENIQKGLQTYYGYEENDVRFN
ncbi:MAG: carbohydrate ABC transporter substrate-binding protein [Acholeplasmataceae bacterium]|nr:carbohydrate ABC transporter substrate-binding protein [Acholeplasmataceae bacterium]